MSYLQKPAMKAEEVVAISTRNAVLRAWCKPGTTQIEPDPALYAALIAEIEPLVQNWHEAAKSFEEMGRQHRVALQRIAAFIGPDAHQIGHDGQPTREVLFERLPDLVKARLAAASSTRSEPEPTAAMRQAAPRAYPMQQQMFPVRAACDQQRQGGF